MKYWLVYSFILSLYQTLEITTIIIPWVHAVIKTCRTRYEWRTHLAVSTTQLGSRGRARAAATTKTSGRWTRSSWRSRVARITSSPLITPQAWRGRSGTAVHVLTDGVCTGEDEGNLPQNWFLTKGDVAEDVFQTVTWPCTSWTKRLTHITRKATATLSPHRSSQTQPQLLRVQQIVWTVGTTHIFQGIDTIFKHVKFIIVKNICNSSSLSLIWVTLRHYSLVMNVSHATCLCDYSACVYVTHICVGCTMCTWIFPQPAWWEQKRVSALGDVKLQASASAPPGWRVTNAVFHVPLGSGVWDALRAVTATTVRRVTAPRGRASAPQEWREAAARSDARQVSRNFSYVAVTSYVF